MKIDRIGEATLYTADVLEALRSMADGSVHCVMTSPPYWGLRDYGADGQIGLESSLEEYVAKMVAVFREMRRVLRADGTCWVNLGDSYATKPASSGISFCRDRASVQPIRGLAEGLKEKDLCGIPWRVAFALQADGWYLRSDIIWAKPNPMPESVTDRPTKSHEYLFILAKGQWKSRVVKFSDLAGEGLHLHADRFQTSSPVRLADSDFGIRFASTILDFSKTQKDLGLSLLDAQIGEECLANGNGDSVSRLPVHHRAAILCSRFLNAKASPKEFFHELHGLGITLSDNNHFLIGGIDSKIPLPPGVAGYGKTSVAIHYPGEIRKFDLFHNQIIVETPSSCNYFYDAEAIREEAETSKEWRPPGNEGKGKGSWAFSNADTDGIVARAKRNRRTVWTIATQPYPEAHFATFPEKLVESCVLAGCPEKCCPECGAPREKEMEKEYHGPAGVDYKDNGSNRGKRSFKGGADHAAWKVEHPDRITEHPTCSCAREDTVPGTFLDPFCGSGTALLVALRLGRRAVGIELKPEYMDLTRKRISEEAAQGKLF